VREESHLDDMRAAIRGDFERLARRRGSQELMHEPAELEPEPPNEPEPPTEPELPAEPEAPPEPEPTESVSEPEHLPAAEAPEDEVPPEEPAAEGETPRRGFFARLLGL
jgi:hypothetical protein